MTAYETVYSSFRDKVNDYESVDLTSEQEAEILHGYLISAISKFSRLSRNVATYNETDEQFDTDLTLEEIDILSELMVVNWTKPRLYNSEKLRNSISTKDYSLYSPANLLAQLRELHKDANKRANSMMNQYSILNSDYETLRGS